MLELAHGPGHLLLRMARQGLRPVGLDLSPQMEALARRRFRRAGLSPRLVRARAQRLPFADGAFRALVATFPTEFILDPATAQEAARVLAPAGAAVIVPVAIPGGRDPLARILRLLYRITGQDRLPPDDPFSAWRDAGFAIHTEWQPVGPERSCWSGPPGPDSRFPPHAIISPTSCSARTTSFGSVGGFFPTA